MGEPSSSTGLSCSNRRITRMPCTCWHAARRAGQPEAAENLIRRAISILPNSADFLGNLGLVLMDQHKIDQAIAAYQQAIRLRPNFAQAHCNLGSAYAACKQWQQAAAAFETAVQLSPICSKLTPGLAMR